MAVYTPTGTKKQKKTTKTTAAYTYDPGENESYQDAVNRLNAAKADIPQYQGTYDAALSDLYTQTANRGSFRFDLNEDKLYEQYRDRYAAQGQLAMRDTVGQAAALTGGYANTYAGAVGQQAYDAYLQQLNDVVPELYGMALDRYTAEGDRLLQQYTMLDSLADAEYGRYEDAVNRYWQNVEYLSGEAENAYARGYENWYNAQQMEAQAEKFAYTKEQDALDRQTAAEKFAYTKEQDALDRQTAAEKFAYTKEQDALDRQTAAEKFAYTKEQDALDRQTAAEQFAYEQMLDAYRMGTDADALSYERAQDSYEKQLAAYDRLAELITSTGYTPTASDLAAAGMTAAQANAYRSVYTAKNPVKTTGSTGTAVKKTTGTAQQTAAAKTENTVLSESDWSRRKAELLREDPAALNDKRTKNYKLYGQGYAAYVAQVTAKQK